jgi:hypothetical protein
LGPQNFTTDFIFQDAVAAFDKALTLDPSLQEARVGKARALLDLGRFVEAGANADAVPIDFSASVTFNGGNPNGVFFHTNAGVISVADGEGINGQFFRRENGFSFATQPDPRVPWQDAGRVGADGRTPLYLQRVMPNDQSPTVYVSGIEAWLIVAESHLRAGNLAQFLAIHNQLRAGIPSLAQLTTPTSQDSAVALHFRERAFWLYSTGHRLGDLRRLIRQYGRDANAVFPAGAYHKGGQYGTDVNLPIPATYGTCLDRSA